MLQRKGKCFFPIDSLECEKLGNFKNPKYTYIYIYCIYINILIIQRGTNSSWFLFTRLSTRKIYCPVKIKLPWQLMMPASDSSKLQSWQWSYKGIRGTVSREKYVHYFSRTARRDACQILVRTDVPPRDIGMRDWTGSTCKPPSWRTPHYIRAQRTHARTHTRTHARTHARRLARSLQLM